MREGEVVVRRTGTIAVTFDHRVVDGARAAEFGLAVIERLEGGTGEPHAARRALEYRVRGVRGQNRRQV